jgi:hypothetical protein
MFNQNEEDVTRPINPTLMNIQLMNSALIKKRRDLEEAYDCLDLKAIDRLEAEITEIKSKLKLMKRDAMRKIV